MTLDIFHQIQNILLIEDIEGLIESGAPADEYDIEAKEIYNALMASRAENLLPEICSIWAKYFSLNEQELALRESAINRVYSSIIKL